MNEYKHVARYYDLLLYPFVGSIRRDILKTVQRLKPRRVIDVCCGTGNQLRLLKRHGIDAVGVDLSPEMIAVSSQGEHAPRCLLQDATAMEYAAETFDLAMVSFALHETGWDNAKAILGEIHRVLAPGGHAILADYAITGRTGRPAQKIVPMIEFMAGKRHYRNFLSYQRHGGLEGLVDPKRFVPVQATYHGLRSVVIQLLRKT